MMVECEGEGPVIIIDCNDKRRSEVRKIFRDQFRVEPLGDPDEVGVSSSQARLYLLSDEIGNFEKLLKAFCVHGHFVPVVLYSEEVRAERVVHCIREGAVAYLSYPFNHQIDPYEFITKYAGPSPDLSYLQRRSQSQKALQALTPREIDVLMGLCEGRTGPEVAEKLGLSPKTIDAHRTSMLKRLGVNSLVAVRMAAEAGWTLSCPAASPTVTD